MARDKRGSPGASWSNGVAKATEKRSLHEEDWINRLVEARMQEMPDSGDPLLLIIIINLKIKFFIN